MRSNMVSIKGRENGVIEIRLDKKADYLTLRDHFIKKLSSTKGFFHGADPSIVIVGRKLSESHKIDIKQIFDIDYDITDVKFSDELDNSLHKYNYKNELIASAEKQNSTPNDSSKGNITPNNGVFEIKILRNGQKIQVEGDYILIGDVNVGAEIYATGNVVILGSLRGMVHAGCKGNTKSIVIANVMMPSQLRIANKIVVFPKKRKVKSCEIAKIQGKNIIVLPFN